ncbi:WxcM-like domain-containing protein [Flavobacterium sp. ANB]|uniref:WxcM-like domain-containing protein n=1 Tax=unclassified Flavobacterium TaxID=196869 RepID=UPI0012B91FC6|nr:MULTISPECIES: WxcM-like domain-containing protein [unclassified Flavobacterium]MBF4517611.1 WxcM-like domain-containing protein [Flavobacterium sp. ANB]MTD70338.1 sugar epimerase [Flavobacterium sp. LC2016-13]
MEPNLISGNCHSDHRGTLLYNNDFDASLIKRIYIIENESPQFIRGWQGHQIEQRWFCVVSGKFKIQLIKVDNWEKPSVNLEILTYLIDSEKLNVLHVPKGYVSSIQSLELNSKLLVMADYLLGEIKDEYRYDIDYFKI